MMMHPSYTEMIEAVNADQEDGTTPVVNSRYSIVMATSHRARQIVDGDAPLVENAEGRKALSVAVEAPRDKILAELCRSVMKFRPSPASEHVRAAL